MQTVLNVESIYDVKFGNGDKVVLDTNDVYFERTQTYKFVDLGLPSGTLWCDRNLGALSVDDFGLYYAWGETEGFRTKWELQDDEYIPICDRQFTIDNYKFTVQSEGGTIQNTSAKNKYISKYNNYDAFRKLQYEDDAAFAVNDRYDIPSWEMWSELYNNCTRERIQLDNGMYTIKFTSKTNGKHIFMPCALGVFTSYYDNTLNQPVSDITSGYYWMSTNREEIYAYSATVTDSYGLSMSYSYSSKYCGLSIRPILRKQQEYGVVDLGLPSGTLWADRCIGASAPGEMGLVFSWGETDGFYVEPNYDGDYADIRTPENERGYKGFTLYDYKFFDNLKYQKDVELHGEDSLDINDYITKYNDLDGLTELELIDDVAYISNKKFRMPTREEYLELIEYTELVGPSQIVSKINGNSIDIYDMEIIGDNNYIKQGSYKARSTWLSTLNDDDNSWSNEENYFRGRILCCLGAVSGIIPDSAEKRYYGLQILPVKK